MTVIDGEDEFFYLENEHVVDLYADLFGYTEQEAITRLRSPEGLEGALSRPRTYAHYQGADLAFQTAVLAHGIAEGQYFIDGNKRTALAACLEFLELNGYRLNASQDELAAWILQLSERRPADELIEELAERIRVALMPTR